MSYITRAGVEEMSDNNFKYFSTFTGIGGFELGIQNAFEATRLLQGIDHEHSATADGGGTLRSEPLCVGYSEIDKYAISVYERQFRGVKNYGDITKINADGLPDFDCLVGGFPCQAFSVAGKRRGFEDTRGTLFFDLARILRAKTPRLFVFENVKGLLSHDNGNTFKTIIAAIDELGYDCQWQVLNSKNHRVPQNRERVIIIGHLRGTRRPEVFPFGGYDENVAIEDSEVRPVAQTVTARYHKGSNGLHVGTLRTHKDGEGFRETKSGLVPTIPARARQDGSGQPVVVNFNRKEGVGEELDVAHTLSAGDHRGLNRNQDQTAVAIPVMAPERGEKRQNGRRFKEDGDPSFTLSTQDRHGVFDGEYSIRRLTPVECERLQAFPDNWTKYGVTDRECHVDCPNKFEHQITEISDTQRYKMCGNAVTTNVIQDVFERIFA